MPCTANDAERRAQHGVGSRACVIDVAATRRILLPASAFFNFQRLPISSVCKMMGKWPVNCGFILYNVYIQVDILVYFLSKNLHIILRLHFHPVARLFAHKLFNLAFKTEITNLKINSRQKLWNYLCVAMSWKWRLILLVVKLMEHTCKIGEDLFIHIINKMTDKTINLYS